MSLIDMLTTVFPASTAAPGRVNPTAPNGPDGDFAAVLMDLQHESADHVVESPPDGEILAVPVIQTSASTASPETPALAEAPDLLVIDPWSSLATETSRRFESPSTPKPLMARKELSAPTSQSGLGVHTSDTDASPLDVASLPRVEAPASVDTRPSGAEQASEHVEVMVAGLSADDEATPSDEVARPREWADETSSAAAASSTLVYATQHSDRNLAIRSSGQETETDGDVTHSIPRASADAGSVAREDRDASSHVDGARAQVVLSSSIAGGRPRILVRDESQPTVVLASRPAMESDAEIALVQRSSVGVIATPPMNTGLVDESVGEIPVAQGAIVGKHAPNTAPGDGPKNEPSTSHEVTVQGGAATRGVANGTAGSLVEGPVDLRTETSTAEAGASLLRSTTTPVGAKMAQRDPENGQNSETPLPSAIRHAPREVVVARGGLDTLRTPETVAIGSSDGSEPQAGPHPSMPADYHEPGMARDLNATFTHQPMDETAGAVTKDVTRNSVSRASELAPGVTRSQTPSQVQGNTQGQIAGQAPGLEGGLAWESADVAIDVSKGDAERSNRVQSERLPLGEELLVAGEKPLPRSGPRQVVVTQPLAESHPSSEGLPSVNVSTPEEAASSNVEHLQRAAVSVRRPESSEDTASSQPGSEASASSASKSPPMPDSATRIAIDAGQSARLTSPDTALLHVGRESRPQGLNPVGGVGEHATQPVVAHQGEPPALQPVRNMTATQAMPLEEPVSPEAIRELAVRTVRFTMAQGESSVTIRLSPESLGDMVVEVKSSHDAVHVRIAATAPTVREALESQMHGLREALAREGIHATSVSVAADSGQGHSAAQFGGRHAFAGDGGRSGPWNQSQTYREPTSTTASMPRSSPRSDSNLDLYA